jgi:hypothetical protein
MRDLQASPQPAAVADFGASLREMLHRDRDMFDVVAAVVRLTEGGRRVGVGGCGPDIFEVARVDADVCTQQTFFANAEVATPWLERHPGGRVMPVADFDAWWRRLRDGDPSRHPDR